MQTNVDARTRSRPTLRYTTLPTTGVYTPISSAHAAQSMQSRVRRPLRRPRLDQSRRSPPPPLPLSRGTTT